MINYGHPKSERASKRIEKVRREREKSDERARRVEKQEWGILELVEGEGRTRQLEGNNKKNSLV